MAELEDSPSSVSDEAKAAYLLVSVGTVEGGGLVILGWLDLTLPPFLYLSSMSAALPTFSVAAGVDLLDIEHCTIVATWTGCSAVQGQVRSV